VPDPGNDIAKAKQKAVDLLNSHVDEMSKAAYNILMEVIEKTFDIKAGDIQGGKDFVKQLNKLSVDVLDLIQSEPKFTGPVSQFIKRMEPISDAITDFQKKTNDIKVPAMQTEKTIVIDETIDKMVNNGLNQNFVQPLRNLIYQNVTSGLSLSDARTQIKEFISGGGDVTGKLGQYVEQTAIQAVDAYSGIINTKILETFDMNGLLITGSLIDNSSPQCRFAIEELNGLITRENWHLVEAIGKKYNGWIDGTSFDNLPINKLHHGCRHNFYPKIVIKKAA
jgi:hypothetical protein